MRNDQDNRDPAKYRTERDAPDACARTESAEALLSRFPGAGDRRPIVDTVRAMQVLLVVENPTIH